MAPVAAHIGEVTCDNAQSEYYLPDMVEILKSHGHAVTISHCNDYRDGLGVNSRMQLAEVTDIARGRINDRLMTEGVTFIDPAQAWIGPDAQIGRDTVVWPQPILSAAATWARIASSAPTPALPIPLRATGA